jgi:hypothetical protein
MVKNWILKFSPNITLKNPNIKYYFFFFEIDFLLNCSNKNKNKNRILKCFL